MHLEHKTTCKNTNFMVKFKLKCKASPLGRRLQCLCNKCYQWNYFSK